MTRTISVFVTTQFAAVHYYPDASARVEFLRHPHRHMFHVKVEISVIGDNRELEFLHMKSIIEDGCVWIKNMRQPFTYSCEQIADLLYQYMPIEVQRERRVSITVSEDGENGATVTYEDRQ